MGMLFQPNAFSQRRVEEPHTTSAPISPWRRLPEVAVAFLRLGLVSFGGPIAHLGYFHAEFVERRGWLKDAEYADLVALCQFLPGPASSQVAFALGMRRAGIAGAVAASTCFTLPSALLMIAFAYGASRAGALANAGWVHGLKLAACAVVAQAVLTMWRRLCPDRPRATIALASAALLLLVRGVLIQVGVIAGGALLGWLVYRTTPGAEKQRPASSPHPLATLALILFAVLLLVLPSVARTTGSRNLQLFDSFYRSGALVFGGGHVVLPLLREELVPRGMLTDDAFLAGYGAAQAVPGPLFTFAAYLGTSIDGAGPRSWRVGLLALFSIFLPAWLLIGGALPFWRLLQAKAWARASILGSNAAVVGILLAALVSPVGAGSITSALDVAVVLVAFALLQVWKAPPFLVVLGSAAAGMGLSP